MLACAAYACILGRGEPRVRQCARLLQEGLEDVASAEQEVVLDRLQVPRQRRLPQQQLPQRSRHLSAATKSLSVAATLLASSCHQS